MRLLPVLIFTIISSLSVAQGKADAIVGKWIALPYKNLIVEVYKSKNEYKAKILWFNDNDDKTKPMSVRLDEKNADPLLRKRKILGLEVLDNMVYNSKSNRWEKGLIYDPKTGRTWSSSATIKKDNTLEVRGYWLFEFIGKDLSFKRI